MTDKVALHREMLRRIADFESLMAEVGDSLPPCTRKDLLDVEKTIATLKAQPATEIPVADYCMTVSAETTLKRIASESDGITVLVGFALMRLARSVTNWLH